MSCCDWVESTSGLFYNTPPPGCKILKRFMTTTLLHFASPVPTPMRQPSCVGPAWKGVTRDIEWWLLPRSVYLRGRLHAERGQSDNWGLVDDTDTMTT